MLKFILLLFIFNTGLLHAQDKVFHISQVPPSRQALLKPDIYGYVAVSIDTVWPSGSTEREDTVFPLWPRVVPGENERGGVYCNLDQDPELEVVYPVGQKVYAFNLDGSNVDGYWPRDIEYFPDGAPAFGDIDGDGKGEIVVATRTIGSFSDGYIYAFEKNGTNLLGFPVNTEGGPIKSPVLADIDEDGKDEIIITINNFPDGLVYVYDSDGTVETGWPQRMNDFSASAVAVGDIDDDGLAEIVCESGNRIYAYDRNGNVLPGFPYNPGNNRVFSYSSPVLADLDNDGRREIIAGDHSSIAGNGMVHVIRSDGTIFPGWPRPTSGWVYAPPSVGDVDQDGSLEIIVGDWSSTPTSKIYGWETDGTSMPGFPIDSIYGVFSQILLADMDGDGEIELMADRNSGPNGYYHGFNLDGTPMEGWPLYVAGSSAYINPFVADLDGDMAMDISGGGYNNASDRTSLYLWSDDVPVNSDLSILTILQYNTRHSGVYGDYLMVGTEDDLPGSGTREISVYPLPAANRLYIVAGREKTLTYRVTDISGKLLIGPATLSDFSGGIDIGSLEQGTYVLLIGGNGQATSFRKFIKLIP